MTTNRQDTHRARLNAEDIARRIRVDVPASSEKIVGLNAAAFEYVSEKPARAHRKAVKDFAAAWDVAAGLQGPDASTADREAAYAVLRLAQAALVATSRDCVADLDANVDALLEAHKEQSEQEAREALALLAQVEEIGLRFARRSSALGRARNKDPRKRWTPHPPEAALRIPGGQSIANARTGFEALLPRIEKRLVTQAEYRGMLKAGEDVSGVAITHSPDGWGPR